VEGKEEERMKEYRIVATVDTEHGNGQKCHHESANPWRDGHPFTHHPYKTKSDAKRVLVSLRKRCKEFDKKTAMEFAMNPRDSIKYTQTNIRIQMREVTEWTDVK
jgi:hypothetical protein